MDIIYMIWYLVFILVRIYLETDSFFCMRHVHVHVCCILVSVIYISYILKLKRMVLELLLLFLFLFLLLFLEQQPVPTGEFEYIINQWTRILGEVYDMIWYCSETSLKQSQSYTFLISIFSGTQLKPRSGRIALGRQWISSHLNRILEFLILSHSWFISSFFFFFFFFFFLNKFFNFFPGPLPWLIYGTFQMW